MNRDTILVRGLDGAPVTLTAEQIDDLAARLRGPLLHPGDDGWHEAVDLWNGMVAKRPALVVQPIDASDVAECIRFARANRALLSAKGGGHNIAGTAIAEDGLTLDMSRMRSVAVDADARLAHVGAGCRLADVDRATQAHGLATVLGFVSDTGVAGLTLGGGLGYLTRRFGWAVDNLAEVEIVTADGVIRTASRDEHADLFWGLRGAGANLGVVTRFTYRLHAVGPTVYGGLVAWPFARAAEVLRTYHGLTERAPRELSVWMVLLRAPAAPFVPEAWQGERVAAMAVCHSGRTEEAEEALAPLRELGDPVFAMLGPQPYVALQSLLDATEPRGAHYYWKTEFAPGLSEPFLDTARGLFEQCPIPEAQIGFLHLGGALNERAWDDGAVGNRDARFAVGVNGKWAPDEPEAERFRAWIHEAWTRLRPFSTGGNYINFQTADEPEERIRATYGRNYDRLSRIKQAYDPENLFRSNRNVQPGRGSRGVEPTSTGIAVG